MEQGSLSERKGFDNDDHKLGVSIRGTSSFIILLDLFGTR